VAVPETPLGTVVAWTKAEAVENEGMEWRGGETE
jgi:hypothetical protein